MVHAQLPSIRIRKKAGQKEGQAGCREPQARLGFSQSARLLWQKGLTDRARFERLAL